MYVFYTGSDCFKPSQSDVKVCSTLHLSHVVCVLTWEVPSTVSEWRTDKGALSGPNDAWHAAAFWVLIYGFLCQQSPSLQGGSGNYWPCILDTFHEKAESGILITVLRACVNADVSALFATSSDRQVCLKAYLVFPKSKYIMISNLETVQFNIVKFVA